MEYISKKVAAYGQFVLVVFFTRIGPIQEKKIRGECVIDYT